MAVCCLLLLPIASLACFAQSKSSIAPVATKDTQPSSAIVSVHELQIPRGARAACNKGAKLLSAKDPAGSIPEFQKAIKAFPNYYEAYARLGAADVDLERWDDAETAFRKSLELSGGHYAPANLGLGLILATVKNQFIEAETVVRAGLAGEPADITGLFALGWVLYSTDRLQEAEKTAREAILSEPNFGGARLLLAQIHLRENDPSAVVDDLDAYLATGITGPLDAKVRAVRAEALRALPRIVVNSEVAEANR